MITNDAFRVFGSKWLLKNGSEIRLLASHCANCDANWFPERSICPTCFYEDLSIFELSKSGLIYAITTIYTGPKGYDTPYSVAYIDFPEGVRVFAQVEKDDHNVDTPCGAPVEAVLGVIRNDLDGTPVYSYKFKPV